MMPFETRKAPVIAGAFCLLGSYRQSLLAFAPGYVAAPIACLVPFEVGDFVGPVLRTWRFANSRHCAFITMIGMEAVVYMTLEVGGTMEPLACPDKDSAIEPLRSIVAVGSAAVWGRVIVAIRTVWGCSDADVDLCLGCGCGNCQANSSDCGECQKFKSVHKSPRYG